MTQIERKAPLRFLLTQIRTTTKLCHDMKPFIQFPDALRAQPAMNQHKTLLSYSAIAPAAMLAVFLLSPLPLKAALYDVTPTLVNIGPINPNDTVSVNIVGSSFPDISTIQFRMEWNNASVLTFLPASSSPGTGFGGTPAFSTEEPSNPALRVILESTEPDLATNPNGIIANLRFTAGTAGTATLSFVDGGTPPLGREITDASGNPLSNGDINWHTLAITVVPEPIEYAFALFACAFVGARGLRWWSAKKVQV